MYILLIPSVDSVYDLSSYLTTIDMQVHHFMKTLIMLIVYNTYSHKLIDSGYEYLIWIVYINKFDIPKPGF